jgi:flagellar assembly protein FliH
MSVATKFLFDTSFDDVPPLLQEAETIVDGVQIKGIEEEIALAFSEDEVNAARDEGFARGKNDGIRESAGAIERQISDTLGAVDERLTHLIASQEQSSTDNAGNAVMVAMAIVRKIFPHLNRRHALEEVEGLVELSIEKIVNEPRITINVSPALHASLNQRLTAITSKAGYEGKVVLRAVSTLLDGDCLIEWTEGGAERNTTAIWQEIDEIIERNLGAREPTTDRIETRSGEAMASVDQTEQSVDDTEILVGEARSSATPEMPAAWNRDVAGHSLGAVSSEPKSLTFDEAEILAPLAALDTPPGEPPEDGAVDEEMPPTDGLVGVETEPDVPRTGEDHMMVKTGEVPSDEGPTPNEETVDIPDAEQANVAADEDAATPRTSDPTEGR